MILSDTGSPGCLCLRLPPKALLGGRGTRVPAPPLRTGRSRKGAEASQAVGERRPSLELGSRHRRQEHVAGAAAEGSAERHGNTAQPELVSCAVHGAELPLLVPSSFSSFHYILEKRWIIFIALECVGKPVRVSGCVLGTAACRAPSAPSAAHTGFASRTPL